MIIPIEEQFPTGSIIQLESDYELFLSDVLSNMIEKAKDGRRKSLREYIRNLWDNESWQSIVEKAETEGSTWYVWWADGVRAMEK